MTVLELRRLNARQSQMLEDLRRTQEQLKVLAATDALTGLANRRAFHDRLKQEQALIDRKGLPASLLMMDLDHFKHINDTYGHPAGDEVLRHFARLCGQVFRASDLVARWGGEEFIALLPRTTLGEACCVAERLRQALAAQPVVVEGGVAIPATTSIGVTEMAPLQPLGQTLRELDERLYAAKTAGRNTVVGDTEAGHPRDA
ncbi:GGDEF domain-containing protein [Caldimonas manganoxidans]|uniref:GGDEF domain-containing protein n=1 Tax=Caldimonas manganoxidans TaxID=196015 RepID=UPI0003771B52|nr:GGDEF domain-containing protein [Caldimonas manganoxidans]